MRRKDRFVLTKELMTRAAQAELIAKAADRQRKLAKAEMRAAGKTFKVAKKVAMKARKRARQAAQKATPS